MNIIFDAHETEMRDLQQIYNRLDLEEAIFMNHYKLYDSTGVSAERWKQFLTHPKVSAWVNSEIDLYKDYQMKQMIKAATDDKKSVGAAQMINALNKTMQDTTSKEGPIIIYTYVPMTAAQEAASPTRYDTARADIIAALGDTI